MSFKSDIFIVIPDNATKEERFAAKELKFFIKEIAGNDSVCIEDGSLNSISEDAFVFSLGKTAFSERFFKNEYGRLFDMLDEEGYALICRGKSAVICGGGDRGTVFGVYGLLGELFDLKIFTKNCYTYKDREINCFPEINKYVKPDFPIRTVGIYPVYNQDYRYIRRMRLRAYDEGWALWGHTYFKIMPPSRYLQSHPDWYSPDKQNLCLSNGEMEDQFVENLKQIIIDHPESRLFMLGQEDTKTFCDCEKCRKNLERFDNYPSGLMLEFTNRVVRRINGWLKENNIQRKICFSTFAYNKTILPPVRENPVTGEYEPIVKDLITEDNLSVMIAPVGSSASYSYFDDRSTLSFDTKFYTEKSLKTKDLFLRWAAVSKKIDIWNYCAYFVDYLCPFLMWEGLDENFRNFKKLNAFYIFQEGTYGEYIPNFSELKIYVCSQLMWDSSQDYQALINEFMDAYYGKGSEEIRKYFDYMNNYKYELERETGLQSFYVRYDDYEDLPNRKFWKYEVLKEAVKFFDKALDDIGYLKGKDILEYKKYYFNILAESVPVKYLLMRLYFENLEIWERKHYLVDIKEVSNEFGLDRIGEFAPKKISEYIREWVWNDRLTKKW